MPFQQHLCGQQGRKTWPSGVSPSKCQMNVVGLALSKTFERIAGKAFSDLAYLKNQCQAGDYVGVIDKWLSFK